MKQHRLALLSRPPLAAVSSAAVWLDLLAIGLSDAEFSRIAGEDGRVGDETQRAHHGMAMKRLNAQTSHLNSISVRMHKMQQHSVRLYAAENDLPTFLAYFDLLCRAFCILEEREAKEAGRQQKFARPFSMLLIPKGLRNAGAEAVLDEV